MSIQGVYKHYNIWSFIDLFIYIKYHTKNSIFQITISGKAKKWQMVRVSIKMEAWTYGFKPIPPKTLPILYKPRKGKLIKTEITRKEKTANRRCPKIWNLESR